MKSKLIITTVFASLLAMSGLFATDAQAQWHGGYGYRGGWVAPALVGGVIGYSLARPYYAPPAVVYAQPQVIYTQPPVYVQQSYPAPQAPAGYHWAQVIDPSTGLQKWAMVPN
jgi:hypothetical protein